MTTQLVLLKLVACFQRLSFSEQDYLPPTELRDALKRLNGEEFDQETFEELWDQCKLNSRGEVKLVEFLGYILKAEGILAGREKDIELDLIKYTHEMRLFEKSNDFTQKKKMAELFEQAKVLHKSLFESLQIIRRPFIDLPAQNDRPGIATSQLSQTPENGESDNEADFPLSMKMKVIFYLSVGVLGMNLLASYLINSFPNLLLMGLLISTFACKFLNRRLIRTFCALLFVSLVADITWYCLVAPHVWYAVRVGMYALFCISYYRFSCVIFMISTGIKTVLLGIFASLYFYDQSYSCEVTLFGTIFCLRGHIDAVEINKNPLGLAFMINENDN